MKWHMPLFLSQLIILSLSLSLSLSLILSFSFPLVVNYCLINHIFFLLKSLLCYLLSLSFALWVINSCHILFLFLYPLWSCPSYLILFLSPQLQFARFPILPLSRTHLWLHATHDTSCASSNDHPSFCQHSICNQPQKSQFEFTQVDFMSCSIEDFHSSIQFIQSLAFSFNPPPLLLRRPLPTFPRLVFSHFQR